MRVSYKRGDIYDNTLYEINVRKNEKGDYQLGPRQLKRLEAERAWRLRSGYWGRDVHFTTAGIICDNGGEIA